MFRFSKLDKPKSEVPVSKTGSSGFSGLLADYPLQRAGLSATRLSTRRPWRSGGTAVFRRQSRAGAGRRRRARGVLGRGEAHPTSGRRREATREDRDGDGRWRAKALAGGPTRRIKRPGKEGNRARRRRRCSPREESSHGSPETTNRRRGRSSDGDGNGERGKS